MTAPRRFRKKPIEVEAIRYDGTNRDAVAEFMGGDRVVKVEQKLLPGPGRGMHEGLRIQTLEGTMRADIGAWIIKGIAGEFYPCREDIFDATYEAIP